MEDLATLNKRLTNYEKDFNKLETFEH